MTVMICFSIRVLLGGVVIGFVGGSIVGAFVRPFWDTVSYGLLISLIIAAGATAYDWIRWLRQTYS
jgi:hypothetical protein